MRLHFRLAICLCAALILLPLRTHAATLEDLQKLQAAKQYEAAIAAVDAFVTPMGWSLAYGGQPVGEAYLGGTHAYLRLTSQMLRPPFPAPADAVPIGAAMNTLDYACCIDLTTGKPTWTRSFPIGGRMAIDPRDDSLWQWDEKLDTFGQFSAADGKSLRTGAVPHASPAPGQLECLRDGQTDLWTRTSPNSHSQSFASQLDLATGKVTDDVPRPFALSADGLSIASLTVAQKTPKLSVSPAPASTAGAALGVAKAREWSKDAPPQSFNPPAWCGNDLLLPQGQFDSPGVLRRLDGNTGEQKWSARLEAYGFVPTLTSLAGGAKLSGGWTPCGSVGGADRGAAGGSAVGAVGAAAVKEVWAADSAGRVHCFDADTGKPTRIITPGNALIAAPLFAADHVLLATRGALYKIPQDPKTLAAMGEALAIKTRALIALKRIDDAVETAGQATACPGTPAAWEALADAMTAANHPAAAVGAKAHGLIAAGSDATIALKQSLGIRWYVATAPITAALLPKAQTLIVGEIDGHVHQIDPTASRDVATDDVQASIIKLRAEGTQTIADCVEGGRRVFLPAGADPSQRVYHSDKPRFADDPQDHTGVDKKWFTMGGHIGPTQHVGNRLVRTIPGGGVRELIDKKMTIRPGTLPDIEQWWFGTAGKTPLGYGTGGVYTLDESLVAQKALIALAPGEGSGREQIVEALAGDDKTIAVAIHQEAKMQLAIYSRDGAMLIRSAPIAYTGPIDHQPTRLKQLGDGYLLSTGELLYLPTDPAKPEWRFSLNINDGAEHAWGEHRLITFTPPELMSSTLTVGSNAGGIFVFNVPAITGGR